MINDDAMIYGAGARRIDGDKIFHGLCKGSAILMMLIMLGVFVLLLHGALPALEKFGASFVWSNVWDPVAEQFGAASAIYGTLVSSLIAMVLAFPVGLAIAVFLAEIAPQWLSRPLGILIELLAAIPSIIYGMWGCLCLPPGSPPAFRCGRWSTWPECRSWAQCSVARRWELVS
ncbi:ABC transporter permease [Dongshaea marina]|uniref:hypothetical protein n=1 Tax=Dongshaea marina TaxID=2047966 RepID=UPI001F175856|nr:hypothetical protein [Dongshaea marina]